MRVSPSSHVTSSVSKSHVPNLRVSALRVLEKAWNERKEFNKKTAKIGNQLAIQLLQNHCHKKAYDIFNTLIKEGGEYLSDPEFSILKANQAATLALEALTYSPQREGTQVFYEKCQEAKEHYFAAQVLQPNEQSYQKDLRAVHSLIHGILCSRISLPQPSGFHAIRLTDLLRKSLENSRTTLPENSLSYAINSLVIRKLC